MRFTFVSLLAFAGHSLAASYYLQLQTVAGDKQLFTGPANSANGAPANSIEVFDYDWSVEQTLSIGSQNTGAGAGQITFNPITISRRADAASPILFRTMALGQALYGSLTVVQSSGNNSPVKLVYSFGRMGIKTMDVGSDESSIGLEKISFAYGSVSLQVTGEDPKSPGGASSLAGWNRVTNVACDNTIAQRCIANK